MLPKPFSLCGALSLILPFLSLGSSAHVSSVAQALRERDASTPGRQLKAATKAANLAKRHTNFFTTNELDLTYIERETLHSEPNFGATVHLKASAPVLFLEDFEHLAEYIVCQPGYITIQVHRGVDRKEALQTLLGLEAGGLVITSHYGCNDHGERRVFRIGTLNVSQHDTIFVLDTVPTSWQSSFSTIDVQMYHTVESHTLRTHQEIRRRQDTETETEVPTATESERPTHTAPRPTTTSTSQSGKLDLAHSVTDKKFLPDSSPVQLGCRNCSTYGSIDFSFVSFSLNPGIGRIFSPPIELGDIFEGGEVEVVATGMGAHVELFTNVSLETGDFSFNLFEIPLLYGIAIPGIGSAGLLYAPDVAFNYNINGSMEFTYGFEIGVPDDSRLFLDMTNPANSSIAGFGDTSINAIPFQATTEIPSGAFINIHLRHMIQIGFEFDKLLINLGAETGVYLDLPRFGATITHLSDVDENCAPLATSQSKNKDVAQKVLTNAYQVTPTVDWQVGIAGEYNIIAFSGGFDEPFGNGTLSDVSPSCLNYNQTSKTYTDAVKVVEQAKDEEQAKGGAIGHLRIAYATYGVAALGLFVSILL